MGLTSASFSWCINACMNLNGTEWLVEINWKNFEKNRKSFGTVFNIWQKNNCERAFLEILDCNNFQRFPSILKKLIFQEKFHRHIQKCAFFCDAIILKQSVKSTLKVSEKYRKTVLDGVHVIVNLHFFFLPPVLHANPSFPKVNHLPPPRQSSFQISPFL